MNQQQLNKIDEEFEKRFTNPNKLDSRSFLHPYYQNGKIGLLLADFKTFLHSKLQEAYELGRRDERERNVEELPPIFVSARSLFIDDCPQCGAVVNRSYIDNLTMEIQDEYRQKVIKSLQTNKE